MPPFSRALCCNQSSFPLLTAQAHAERRHRVMHTDMQHHKGCSKGRGGSYLPVPDRPTALIQEGPVAWEWG